MTRIGYPNKKDCICLYKETGYEYEPTCIVYMNEACKKHGHIVEQVQLQDPLVYSHGISIELLNILESKPVGF